MSRSDLVGQLKSLVATGHLLYYAMADELGAVADEARQQLKDRKVKIPNFETGYDAWYSVAMRVVAQVLPDRLADFVVQYKNDKRKNLDPLTYTISDYLLGIKSTRGVSVIVEPNAGLPKMKRQLAILEAAKEVFKSSLLDVGEVLQADLFDSELEAAAKLGKQGFARCGGAIAGVVLEKHLARTCETHGLKSGKRRPTINDLNQLLKDDDKIETAQWRFVQHLGDLRNLCDHDGDRESTMGDVAELIEGVGKVIKTVS